MNVQSESISRLMMNRVALMLFALAFAVSGVLVGSSPAGAATGENPVPPGSQVCPAGDSGKIDVQGDQTSITLSAPDGKLITGYCVKAGSVNNDNGPVYVPVQPPTAMVTITYPGGKAISHYSLFYTDAPTPPPPPVCPDGQVPVDTDGDGVVEPGECGTDVPPPNPPTPMCPNGTPWVDANMNGQMDECGTTPTPPTPPFSCPDGQFYAGDLNNNGVMDAADCQVPPVKPKKLVYGKAYKLDKCGTVGDRYGVRASKGVVYKADGKRVKREGQWLKTKGDLRIVITAKAASDKYKLAGPRRWVLTFKKNPCPPPPTDSPDLGQKIAA